MSLSAVEADWLAELAFEQDKAMGALLRDLAMTAVFRERLKRGRPIFDDQDDPENPFALALAEQDAQRRSR